MAYSYSYGQIMISIGLLLSILGSIIIVWPSAVKFLKSWFSSKTKAEIEDEAIATVYARIQSAKRDHMLEDPYVIGFISTYRRSFLGFIFLILGFVFQLVGTLW